jgi:hypothetical protein
MSGKATAVPAPTSSPRDPAGVTKLLSSGVVSEPPKPDGASSTEMAAKKEEKPPAGGAPKLVCGMHAGLFAALAYSLVSITITLFNKASLARARLSWSREKGRVPSVVALGGAGRGGPGGAAQSRRAETSAQSGARAATERARRARRRLRAAGTRVGRSAAGGGSRPRCLSAASRPALSAWCSRRGALGAGQPS